MNHRLSNLFTATGEVSWLAGVGIGGPESNIGTYSTKEACYTECSKRSYNGVYANGASAYIDTGAGVGCYCKFGMTSTTGSSSFLSAYILPCK